jgi:hypothetical protein
LSHVLDRGAHAVSNGTARSLSQVIDLGVQAVARVAAILSQQEKITSADVQRKFFFTGCIYIVRSGNFFLPAVSI